MGFARKISTASRVRAVPIHNWRATAYAASSRGTRRIRSNLVDIGQNLLGRSRTKLGQQFMHALGHGCMRRPRLATERVVKTADNSGFVKAPPDKPAFDNPLDSTFRQ